MKIRNKNTIEEAISIIVLIATKKKAVVVGLVFYMPGQNSMKKITLIILTADYNRQNKKH